MSGRIPISEAGMRRMKEELKQLQSVERPKISAEIEVARAHGDLRENAEYHAAKEKQGHIEGRIMDLNGWIGNAEVIEIGKFKGTDTIVFGANVELLDLESDKPVRYQILGEFEADLKKRRISINSPVARGLVGKKKGEVVTIQSPGGTREYEVVSVSFEEPT